MQQLKRKFSIKDILKGKEVYCSMNTNNINIYLNDKIICELNVGLEENIKYLLNELKGKIPKESKIKYEDLEVELDEAIDQEFTIKNILFENSIYFINKQAINETISKNIENEEISDSSNILNKNQKLKDTKKFIHIYKNGEIIKMTTIDVNSNISSLRELLKDEISENSKFLSEGTGVPYKDENHLKIFHIIKDEKIYIEDSDIKDCDSQSTYAGSKKEKVQIQFETIPIILKFEGESNSIIKASLSDRLDGIRDGNTIPDNFIFTLKGTEINKTQEKNFFLKIF